MASPEDNAQHDASDLQNTLNWLLMDKGRNALSTPRNKKSRVRNGSRLAFLSSLRTQPAGSTETYIHTGTGSAFMTEGVHPFPLAHTPYSGRNGPTVSWATSTVLLIFLDILPTKDWRA